LNLALLAADAGKDAKARAASEQAVALDPRCAEGFLRKAESHGGFEAAVAEVIRRCKNGRGRRRARPACMVGRLQTIEQYLEATADAGPGG